ncbi:MAG: response regulator [Candidatus Omnitrophota bacterium]|nr:response regulator [Candidatus Omnitrophota bacterium]
MPKKILIVDDDAGICNSLAILLRGEGYCVDEVTDSGAAALLIKKDKYDLCLFDYKMKGLSGIDLLNMTKEINPQSAVFIISGMLDLEELCAKERNAGLIAAVISKPFDVETLLQRIAAAVK